PDGSRRFAAHRRSVLGHHALPASRPDQLEHRDEDALARGSRHRSALRHHHSRLRFHAVLTPALNRILVIRGGAIGDFILTLPAIKGLRHAYSAAQIDILGYRHIAALAENRFYADRVRSIESGVLSRLFANVAALLRALAH